MSQKNGVLAEEGFDNHPFKSSIEASESVLWVGRPDRTDFVRRSWRTSYIAIGLLGLFMISIIAVAVYDPSPIHDFFFVMFSILLPITVWMFVSFARNAYKDAPWYALTDRRLFAATPDEGSPVIHKTELSNIKDVFVLKREDSIGTVRCSCHAPVSSLWSRTLNVENIQHPQRIAEMIAEAKCRASAGVYYIPWPPLNPNPHPLRSPTRRWMR